jgi:hypothetical protein
MLNNFGLGWRNLFESHVEYVKTSMSEVNILSIERYNAMLRIKFETTDEHLQFILDCFAYKVERDSAKTCEFCGEYGFRRFSEWLKEPLCLCTPCYVKHVDSILSQQ